YDYFQQFIFTGYYLENWFLVYAFVLVMLAYFIFIFPGLYKIALSPIGVLFIAIMILFAVSWCEGFRCRFRSQAYLECTTMHDLPRYWVPALEAIDSMDEPAVIAFAYGPEKMSHNAYLAPFLGAHLENRVIYVPPDKDGDVPAYSEKYFSEVMDPEFEQWLDGLVEMNATHLLCLRPASNEILWAEKNPILFNQIEGESQDWGLFEVNLNSQKIGTP
ncbi:hypothetical protein K8I31_22400, partial [bacterium]|nr:hypothetical protein [bacterium]